MQLEIKLKVLVQSIHLKIFTIPAKLPNSFFLKIYRIFLNLVSKEEQAKNRVFLHRLDLNEAGGALITVWIRITYMLQVSTITHTCYPSYFITAVLRFIISSEFQFLVS